jgi:putative hydrolase
LFPNLEVQKQAITDEPLGVFSHALYGNRVPGSGLGQGIFRRQILIDFHTHTYFSDGILGPSELVRRAFVTGYRAIGIADHVDGSNLDFVCPRIVKVARDLNDCQETLVIPGVEITHIPPGRIKDLVSRAREMGAVLVVVHGESPVEPVAPGTNKAAIRAGADILAHPGFITIEEAKVAAEKGVYLEITSRRGHSLTNGHVAKMRAESGAALVVNTDAHAPEDLIGRDSALKVLMGAGMTVAEAEAVLATNETLFESLKKKLATLD